MLSNEVGGDEVAVCLVDGGAEFCLCVAMPPVEVASKDDGVCFVAHDAEVDVCVVGARDKDAAIFDEEWFEGLGFCEETGAGQEAVELFCLCGVSAVGHGEGCVVRGRLRCSSVLL